MTLECLKTMKKKIFSIHLAPMFSSRVRGLKTRDFRRSVAQKSSMSEMLKTFQIDL